MSSRAMPRPKTTGKGTLIAIRWQEPDLAIVDDFASTHGLSRGEALREIVRRSQSTPRRGRT